jgi:hypothetical protein
MRRALLAAAITLAALPLAAQAPAPAAPAAAPAATGAKIWPGHYAELEQYLREAPREKMEDIPVGVTKPKRLYFAPGGPVKSAAVKFLPMGQRGGFWESHRSEIAAYELDKLLGLEMVPVTIERRVGADLASVQMWVEGCKLLKDVDQKSCPRPMDWAKQVCRQRAFDNLIANIDRNAGNLLVDGEWNLILIDHTRAFAADRLPFEKEMTRVDREFFSRLKALDEAGLREHVRPWLLNDGQMKGILKRRDKIVAILEKLARDKGESAVFPF